MTRWDGFLFIVALLGLGIYVGFLPAHHPDAAADYTLEESEIITIANAFLGANGYPTDGLDTEVQMLRENAVLNTLQRVENRPAVTQYLKATDAERLPVYYWELRYFSAFQENDGGRNVDLAYRVLLTPEGTVWDFKDERDLDRQTFGQQPSLPLINRRALQSVFPRSENLEDGSASWLSQVPDSVFIGAFTFDPADSLWRSGDATLLTEEQISIPFEENRSRILKDFNIHPDSVSISNTYSTGEKSSSFALTLPQGTAVELAHYHLEKTFWPVDAFQIDSVFVLPDQKDQVSRVLFSSVHPQMGHTLQAGIDVAMGGALRKMEVDIEPLENPKDSLDDVADVVKGFSYFILCVILIIGFFRRMGARLIDGKTARVDGILLGLLMATFFVLLPEFGDFVNGSPSPWAALAIRAGVSVFTGLAVGLFFGMISSSADSMARDTNLGSRLRTASLVRLGSFRNVYVGASLLRGLALGLALLGLFMLILLLFPSIGLEFPDREMPEGISFRPMVTFAALAGLDAFLVLVLLLGLAAMLFRWRRSAATVVCAFTMGLALMQGTFFDLIPAGYTIGIWGAVGAVLGLAFWQFDFLTAFVGYFVAELIWVSSPTWLATASPLEFDLVLLILLLIGLFGFGLVGVTSRRSGRAVVEYTPAYITEMKQQERVSRELEIAYQVQESLLPKRMPEVEGLDIAAMCLAALEVGGDYYDFVEIAPGKLAVVVGDVSGKGIQAAFYMTLTKGFVQTLSREEQEPAQVMRRLNTLFCENAPRGTFISMIYGIFDVEARTFTFARAGHNPVILKRSPSQQPDLIQPAGLAIGLISGPRFDDAIEETTLTLHPGDVLVFYTDGFSEAMNMTKEQYTDQRLAEKVGVVGSGSANQILRAVSEDVHGFVEGAGRHDDMTMVVVKLGYTAKQQHRIKRRQLAEA